MGFSIQHLLLTLAIVVLVFGTKRLSTVGTDIGGAIKGFRRAIKDSEDDNSSPGDNKNDFEGAALSKEQKE